MQAAPAALFWTCVVVIGPAFGVAGGWVAGMRGTPILWGVLLGICGVYGGWFLGGLVSIGMASAGMEALSRPMAVVPHAMPPAIAHAPS